MLGVAQPTALQMSASEAPRVIAQDDALPLAEWARNLSWAGHTLCFIGQGDGTHYPVGHSVIGDSIPLLLSSVKDKELFWGLKALSSIHILLQCMYRTDQS